RPQRAEKGSFGWLSSGFQIEDFGALSRRKTSRGEVSSASRRNLFSVLPASCRHNETMGDGTIGRQGAGSTSGLTFNPPVSTCIRRRRPGESPALPIRVHLRSSAFICG